MEIEIRILKKKDDRDSFSCGDISLDYFFQRFAGQNQFKHYIGTTYIATDNKNILGFVSVSTGSLIKDNLPQKQRKKLPHYPLPILRISRLAVDEKYKKRGVGKQLLKSMFKLALQQKEMFGCIGVVVDAKDTAVDFYKKLGFIELDIDKGITKHYPKQSFMFLPISMLEDNS